jgi:hypothetical protein
MARLPMTDVTTLSSVPSKNRTIRRCRLCGCSIDHMAARALYCGPAHRTKDTRLRKKCARELASADRDGGFLLLPVSQINALGEELGLNPQDEGDRLLVAELLVMKYHDRGQKIRDLEAELRRMKAQA